MEWMIGWNSGLLDEIGLVYEKAERDTFLCRKLNKLEETALREAMNACQSGGLLSRSNGGKVLSKAEFDALSAIDKETAIVMLGEIGLASRQGGRPYFETDYSAAIISVRLSSSVVKTKACTLFDILNRLEKLDGAANIVGKAAWSLKLRVPGGNGAEYVEWKEVISRLFPWITVSVLGTEIVNKKTVVASFCFGFFLLVIAFLCIKLAIVMEEDTDTKLGFWGLGLLFVLFGGLVLYRSKKIAVEKSTAEKEIKEWNVRDKETLGEGLQESVIHLDQTVYSPRSLHQEKKSLIGFIVVLVIVFFAPAVLSIAMFFDTSGILSQSDKNIGLVVGSILIAAMAFAIWVSIRNYRDRLKKGDRVQNLATEIYKSRIGVSTEDEANETNDSEGGNKP